MKKTIEIAYQELAIDELEQSDRELVDSAMSAAMSAHNPYSHFFVGAALRLEDGSIVTGSNQENIAYPSGLCAERTAMFAASHQKPGMTFDTLAIVGATCKGDFVQRPGEDQLDFCPASPCGACRQVMAEYENRGGRKLRILLYSKDNKICIFDGVESLLPFIFAM